MQVPISDILDISNMHASIETIWQYYENVKQPRSAISRKSFFD